MATEIARPFLRQEPMALAETASRLTDRMAAKEEVYGHAINVAPAHEVKLSFTDVDNKPQEMQVNEHVVFAIHYLKTRGIPREFTE